MLRALASSALAAAFVVSCGGGGAPTSTLPASTSPATAATSPRPAAGAIVTVKGFRFGPQQLEVPVGTAVSWTNQDGAQHTTTSGKPGSPDGKWSGELDPSGGAFAFTFTSAGTFAYFCSIHGAAMTGTIVVK